MSKYADIEQIEKVIREEWIKYIPMEFDINIAFVLGKIAEVPTIEIIRCKDCKFCEKHEDYSPTPIEPPWCYCKNLWVMRETGFNDFCSYGERIESEE